MLYISKMGNFHFVVVLGIQIMLNLLICLLTNYAKASSECHSRVKSERKVVPLVIRKKLSLLVIVLGIIIFLYPTLNDRYESYQQNKILKQWQENLQNMDQTASDIEEETDAVLAVPSSSPAVEALPTSSQLSPLAEEMTPKPVTLP